MRAISWLCALLIFISLFPIYTWFSWLPDWYQQLWKAFVCAGAIWLAWKDFKNKSLAVWNLALLMIAIFYNPIFPFMIRSSFIAAAIGLLCILFLIVFGYKRNIYKPQ